MSQNVSSAMFVCLQHCYKSQLRIMLLLEALSME